MTSGGLTPDRLGALAGHILPVTILSVLFVIVGVAFRAGFLDGLHKDRLGAAAALIKHSL